MSTVTSPKTLLPCSFRIALTFSISRGMSSDNRSFKVWALAAVAYPRARLEVWRGGRQCGQIRLQETTKTYLTSEGVSESEHDVMTFFWVRTDVARDTPPPRHLRPYRPPEKSPSRSLSTVCGCARVWPAPERSPAGCLISRTACCAARSRSLGLRESSRVAVAASGQQQRVVRAVRAHGRRSGSMVISDDKQSTRAQEIMNIHKVNK